MAKASTVGVQGVAGSPLPTMCPLKILPSVAGIMPGVSPLLQAGLVASRIGGSSFLHLNPISTTSALLKTLQPALHGVGLLGHPL